jgi:hypothetical protein
MSLVMQAFSLTGTNGTVTLDANGVTIEHRIFGRTKSIPWQNLAGATIKKGNWLTRPKLVVLTKAEQRFATSNAELLKNAASDEIDAWAIAIPMGEDAQWEGLKSAINQVLAGHLRELAPGERVLVQWSDGQKYIASLAAIEPQQMLVVFPNGTQNWVPREHVQRA